jgi:hypothetical protein
MTVKRVVASEDVHNLPTEIHRKVARQLILTGEWVLETISGNRTRNEGRMG